MSCRTQSHRQALARRRRIARGTRARQTRAPRPLGTSTYRGRQSVCVCASPPAPTSTRVEAPTLGNPQQLHHSSSATAAPPQQLRRSSSTTAAPPQQLRHSSSGSSSDSSSSILASRRAKSLSRIHARGMARRGRIEATRTPRRTRPTCPMRRAPRGSSPLQSSCAASPATRMDAQPSVATCHQPVVRF